MEPTHSPDTEQERRTIYTAERPIVRQFEYASLPGHAVVCVKGASLQAKIYSGITRELWKTVNLSGWLAG